MFCFSSCHCNDKILNQMIFISDFSCSSAFYLIFSSACRLLVTCTLRLLKFAWSRKLCMWSMHSTSSLRSILMSFKLDEVHDCSFSDVNCWSFSCCIFDQLIHCFVFNNVFTTQYSLYANMTLILLQIDQILSYVIK